MREDVEYLIGVVEKAKDRSLWGRLGLDLDEDIVIPRFDQYIKMLKERRIILLKGGERNMIYELEDTTKVRVWT